MFLNCLLLSKYLKIYLLRDPATVHLTSRDLKHALIMAAVLAG
jgi:hypothetical protein